MHGTYAALEREGKIGNYTMEDGQLKPKPFQEYPKYISTADGRRVIVKDFKEECTIMGEQGAAPASAPDPLAEEKAKLSSGWDKLKETQLELDRMKDEMKAQMAELSAAREAIQSAASKPAQPVSTAPSVPPTSAQSKK